MTAKYTEAVAALLLLGFSIFAWTQVAEIGGSARVFPQLIIYALTFFSLVYFVRSLAAARPVEGVIERGVIFAIVLISSLGYINGVAHLGYVTSTLLFIPAATWMIGFRRPLYILTVTLAYIVSVYLLFEVAFGRPLPSEMLLETLRGIR